MPKYRVLDARGIEHGAGPDANIVHFPKGAEVPKELISGGHGKPVPTDTSGLIELTEQEAAQLQPFHIPFLNGKPASVDQEEAEAKRSAEEKAAEEDRVARDKKEFEEFQEWRRAKRAEAGLPPSQAEQIAGDKNAVRAEMQLKQEEALRQAAKSKKSV